MIVRMPGFSPFTCGLEWLFRLLTEPHRLWRRYLVNNPMFVALVVLQALGV
jgi:N-acetylglucosaminyldiphosphoundecaprenol N-acetyl-beta-D-mannosaminyltransferase